MNKLKVLELFGGIGAPRKALQNLGIDFEVVDYVEIDKYAVKSYNAMYGENYTPQSVLDWDKVIDVDLLVHGSPCQDFSPAGAGGGGDAGSGTRSSLMFETVRIVKEIKPKFVIWENVKGVLNKNHRHNFEKYLSALEKLGYKNYYQVLNSKDYGVPQNRQRIFVVSTLEDVGFSFPKPFELKLRLGDILEKSVDKKYYLSDRMKKYINSYDNEKKDNGAGTYKVSTKRLVLNREVASTISTRTGVNRADCSDYLCDDFSSNAPINGIDLTNFKIRKLTPLECWRVMGFDEKSFLKAQSVNSNTQLYKQAGNSIVVPVLEEIFKNLL